MGRLSPTMRSFSGTTFACLFLLVSGYSCSSRFAIARISSRACSTVTPSFNRAIAR